MNEYKRYIQTLYNFIENFSQTFCTENKTRKQTLFSGYNSFVLSLCNNHKVLLVFSEISIIMFCRNFKDEISFMKTFHKDLEMETNEIIQIISNFGFPVLMCLLLFYYIRNEQKKTNETLQELRQVIDRNTTIIELFIKDKRNE